MGEGRQRWRTLHHSGPAGDGCVPPQPEALESYALKSSRQGPRYRPRRWRKNRDRKSPVDQEQAGSHMRSTGRSACREATSPDWEPVMKIAAAIVTDHGGRTCHAAIVARELGSARGRRDRKFRPESKDGYDGHGVLRGWRHRSRLRWELPFEVERIAGRQAEIGHDRHHGQSRQSGNRLSRPRWRRTTGSASPGWNYHQPAYRRAPDGAG